MKKFALAMVLVGFSYGVLAATACSVGTATPVATPAAGSTDFIKNGITPRCSANTYVEFTQSTTKVDVGSASLKGKKYFGGSSEGGAVTARGDCTATCAIGDAQSGVSAAAGTASGTGTGTGT